jgi:rubredoxin
VLSPTFLQVKSLPSPRRAVARAQSATIVAKATYICIDCGYIYDESTAWEKLPSSYKCPVCSSPKRRFKPYNGGGKNDPKSMKARMQTLKSGGGDSASSSGGGDSSNAVAIAVGGAVLLAALYFGLSGFYG